MRKRSLARAPTSFRRKKNKKLSLFLTFASDSADVAARLPAYPAQITRCLSVARSSGWRQPAARAPRARAAGGGEVEGRGGRGGRGRGVFEREVREREEKKRRSRERKEKTFKSTHPEAPPSSCGTPRRAALSGPRPWPRLWAEGQEAEREKERRKRQRQRWRRRRLLPRSCLRRQPESKKPPPKPPLLPLFLFLFPSRPTAAASRS